MVADPLNRCVYSRAAQPQLLKNRNVRNEYFKLNYHCSLDPHSQTKDQE
ncbi:hypothetical protein Cabys_525 [Caldithrix abyssi DSM 13497]|uniref:Uncharacterized protein n=1 Tax=Caldithrix abyssi DSM 13497 TaxID=880073 RepID=A0A1J1C4E7_CALAY|nr:hypothetical protein Cabys_525 [Caldithrix abyssi DSM 13497]